MALEQSFPAADLPAIDVEIRRGDVHVDAGTGDQIIVRADFSGGASTEDLLIEPVGGTLRISQPVSGLNRRVQGFLEDFDFGHLKSFLGRVDLRLSVPSNVRHLSVTTGLGSVWVERCPVEVRVRTGKGDVTLGTGAEQVDVTCGMGAVRITGFAGACALQTGLGEVTLADGQGSARIRTGKGKVEIRDGTLDLEATTGLGEVHLDRLSGRANVRTALGDLAVVQARALALEAQTGNGAVRLGGEFRAIRARSGFGGIAAQPSRLSGSAELTTGNGSIDVTLPSGQAIRVDAGTGRGQVESDVPLMPVGQPGPEGYFSRRVVGTFGSGEIEATLRVRTGNGNVRLRQARAVVPPEPAADTVAAAASASGAPAPPAEVPTAATAAPETPAAASPGPGEPAPAPGPSRLEILQALSRGEITVEEAERRLLQM